MIIEKISCCKVNLLLNILGRRTDGFHELETVMHPVNLADHLRFQQIEAGIELACNSQHLRTDSSNLVYRAAELFLKAAGISKGARIHLKKNIPLAAGLGGGSGNAAATLLGLNDLFGHPVEPSEMTRLAAHLGSDVPFFLQPCPALATGRGERIVSLEPFPALKEAAFLLVHPGFGVSTAWAYESLSAFPDSSRGQPGRAQQLVEALEATDLRAAAAHFYNALEAPVLRKYPLLALIKEFLFAEGAPVALMSGSGSTIFAIVQDVGQGRRLEEKAQERFGPVWTCVVPV